jgi:hypothetical protein
MTDSNKTNNSSIGTVTGSTGNRKPTAEPRTEQELAVALSDLITAAHENGITVEGGWDVHEESPTPDWEVHVTEVVKKNQRDSTGQD